MAEIELKTIETVSNQPFRKLVTTIGELPSAFIESMSYYEMLAWLVNWLENTVIPAVNNNAEAVEELQGLFVELKTFVDNYFENLDVQDEINNKLDQMVEDGTLQEIISQYIQANVAWTFDSVAEMKTATNLVNGSYAKTIGFYSANDGGGAIYKIVNTGEPNEMDIIALGDNLRAHLIIGDTINVKQLGAYGDNEHDDDEPIKRAIALGRAVYIPKGQYIVGDVIDLPNNTEIFGENYRESIISKSVVTSPNTVFRFTGTGRVKVRNIGIECNQLTDYGFIATTDISYFELSDIRVNQPITAGFYFNHSTYLGTINRCIVENTTGHGFRIVPSDPNAYFNTSINLSNCYVSECRDGYAIHGSYMNMENCACDGATNYVYDLTGFVGTLVSCGSESYRSKCTFHCGDQLTNVTIINPKTFGSFDIEDSTHIFVGLGADVVFVGGNIGYPFRTQLSVGLGRFLEQRDGGHIKFIGTRIRGNYSKPNITSTAIQVDDYDGNIMAKTDLAYLGYSQGQINSRFINNMDSSAIYLGANDEAYHTKNIPSQARGFSKGDMFITKTPAQVNGAGWICNTDGIGRITNGQYFKIPIVQKGATSERPTRGLVVGDMFYDTTLNMPVWCTNVGRREDETISIVTAPVTNGTITFSYNGNDYPLAVQAGMTKSDLYQALLNANIEGVIIEEYGSSVHVVCKDYKAFGGQPIFTINVGDTGAELTQSVSYTGANPTWKSLAEFAQ